MPHSRQKSSQKAKVFTPEKVSFASHIGQKFEGKTLLYFLTQRFTYFSQDLWLEKIAEADVKVNGKIAGPELILQASDKVEYFSLTRPEPRVPQNIPVLFEDEDLLVVNKPPHIPVHPSGRYLRNTLIHLLQKKRKGLLVLSHRLDRETSGVCILSKTPLAKDKMYWAFYKNEVKKTYWALCWGIPEKPGGLIDAPIGLASAPGSAVQSKIRIKQAVHGGESKTAKTKYQVLSTSWIEAPLWKPPQWEGLQIARLKNPKATPSMWPVSLVEAKPITGRTNQIRVHLAHIGIGLLGDKLYDPDEDVFMEYRKFLSSEDKDYQSRPFLKGPLKHRLVLEAHALHAKAVEFRHPRTQRSIRIEAPAPADWQGLYTNPKR